MADYTEEETVPIITINPNGSVGVRNTTRIFRDGKELTPHVHGHVIYPGHDYSVEHLETQRVCELIHTRLVIATFQLNQAETTMLRLLQQNQDSPKVVELMVEASRLLKDSREQVRLSSL